MAKYKNIYKKGMEYFHNETKEKIMFAKWNEDKTASCLNVKTKIFLTLTKADLDENYTSYAAKDREYRERRKAEAW